MAGHRLHADEIEIDDELVRGLVDVQFPEWSLLPLRRVNSTGTDNAIYRLGDELGVWLPRIGWAVQQIAKEFEWLPFLGPRLAVGVPEPLAKGEPANGYPYPWLVYRWLDGDDALCAPVDEWCGLARDVGSFVGALQAIDATHGPASGPRGRALAPHDDLVRMALRALEHEIDVDRAVAVWDEALEADPWPGPELWVHGDLLPGNVLVRDGRLVGIVDWSAAGVGDPACEAMFAWSLPPDARAAYLDSLHIDDATWARGRGWSLQQAAFFIPYYADTIPGAVAAARERLGWVLADE